MKDEDQKMGDYNDFSVDIGNDSLWSFSILLVMHDLL